MDYIIKQSGPSLTPSNINLCGTSYDTLHEADSVVHRVYRDIYGVHDGPLQLAVSYVGSWKTRGFHSPFRVGFVIEVLTGLVIDYTIRSKYGKVDRRSFALVTDYLGYVKYAVHDFLNIRLDNIRAETSFHTVHFYSDGAACQFKQKYNFVNITYMSHYKKSVSSINNIDF